MNELEIEAPPEELEELRQLILAELGEKADLQEVTSARAGELREPVLVSLVVALGGPAVVTGVVAALKAWFKHREEMEKLKQPQKLEELKLVRFSLLSGAVQKELTVDEVLKLAGESRAQ